MKIVLDTNVLISGIFWKGLPSKILERWLCGDLQAYATKKMLKEYFDVLDRMDPSRQVSREWQLLILEHVRIVEEGKVEKFSRDPNDDTFIHCALAANASYIISGDNDLLVLKQISSINIVTPAEFYRIVYE